MRGNQQDWGEATWSDYVAAVWAGRRTIAIAVFCATAITALVVFLMPPTYEAQTTLLPATPADNGSLLGRFGVNLEDFGAPGSAGSPVSYPDVLRSRRLLSKILFMPVHRSEASAPEPFIETLSTPPSEPRRSEVAIKVIRSDLSASVDRRTGILSIRFRSRFPRVAAEVANALDSLLVDFTIGVLASQAGTNRRFIEGRLADSQGELALAEERLSGFRQRNVRFGSSSRLTLEENRLARALRAEEEVYLTLRRQHELARIEERRDVPSLVLLDPATTPIFRSSPKRVLVVGCAFVLAFLLSVVWVIASGKPANVMRVVQSDDPESLRASSGHAGV